MARSVSIRIETLLATIRTVSGQPSIRLNPADLASIQPLVDTREKLRHCNFVADESLAHGDLSVMVGSIGIDDIIVSSKAAAKNTGETASDKVGDEAMVEAEFAAIRAAEVTEAAQAADVKEAKVAPDTKTVADPTAADIAEPQDGDQDV